MAKDFSQPDPGSAPERRLYVVPDGQAPAQVEEGFPGAEVIDHPTTRIDKAWQRGTEETMEAALLTMNYSLILPLREALRAIIDFVNQPTPPEVSDFWKSEHRAKARAAGCMVRW